MDLQRMLYLCWLKMHYPHSWVVILLTRGLHVEN